MAKGNESSFVTCFIDMRFLPEHLAQAVQLLLSTVGRTEVLPECRSCTVARDASEEGMVHYSETWDSEAAFRQHLKSEIFRRVLTAMDMCREEPQVTVGNLSGHTGVAHLRAIRDRHDET